ncbi:kinesin-like protein KIF2A isoform X1 [Penaeus monodon]|uniref:kinesin-like protein KIF2A isoform X1 n=1 Tax=Penaeus monodon TaxID=6687 RepID=UPI0018A72858|nr:kinesin-like protein KIF2A isoform X1 [Penaeus monodon]
MGNSNSKDPSKKGNGKHAPCGSKDEDIQGQGVTVLPPTLDDKGRVSAFTVQLEVKTPYGTPKSSPKSSSNSTPIAVVKYKPDLANSHPASQVTPKSTPGSTPTSTPTARPKFLQSLLGGKKGSGSPGGTPKSTKKSEQAPSPTLTPTPKPKVERRGSIPVSITRNQNQGRVHSATCSAVNPATRSVTVEWFEKGETKGKEIEFDAVFALNPDLAPQDQNAMPPPSRFDDDEEESSLSEADLSDYVSGLNVGRTARGSGRFLRSSHTHSNVPAAYHPQRPPSAHTSHLPRPPGHQVARSQSASRLTMYSRQSQITQPSAAPVTRSKDSNRPRPSYLVKPPQNGELRSNAVQNKIGQTPARSTENISTSTVSKAASVPASRRRSNVVKEVDRIQKKREERRKQQAEKKEEKEALMNLDPGNPQWEFLNMIREFRSQLEFRTLKDGDPLEEHQITVAVRKRPLNKKETGRREIDVITIPKRNTLYVHEPRTKVDLTKFLENQNFRFDYAFDESCNNELVYKYTARPLVQTIFEGGMATCFAYGQTGSGKTHTMGGDFQGKNQDTAKGVYAMVAKDVFTYVKSPKFRNLNLQISASFFEIYGGKVFDLLNGKAKLRVLEDGKNVVQVVGLQERVCESVDDVLKLISLGSNVRTSGQTAANNQSSRSHAVFQIILRNLDKIEKQGDKAYKLHGKFSLIDLAGNERGADTSSANRQTRMEGAEINKSLLALKECIRALGRKGAHLPFRASKLTQVLRDSFIGDKSKTCMIAMISPGMSCCEHTLNTLRYADRVKELGVSDVSEEKSSPTEKEPDENGTNDEDYSRLTSYNENEMSADQQAFQVAMSALQEAEEEVVDLHGQYFAHRDKMDKMLIPLYQMTNEVDYDVDAYAQQLEDVVLENMEWWTQLRDRVIKLRHQLEEEEKLSRRQHV